VNIVTRDEWGARPPKSVTPSNPTSLKGVTVHWFGSPKAAATHDGCPRLLQAVQRVHMAPGGLGVPQGGNDIAYNHAVCPHGFVYELRGFNTRTGANGTTPANLAYSAVVYMAGNGDPFTQAGKRGMTWILREWRTKGAGSDVKPHGYWTGSECPGPLINLWLRQGGYLVQPPNNEKRLEALRKWVAARRAEGFSWERIKSSANWKEFKSRGGK
jgi:hypothetical protein